MIEFRSDLEKLNENFSVFSKSVFELLEHCAKTENHTTSTAHKITDLRQELFSMDERKTEINDRMTKLEQRRNTPTSQEPSLAPAASWALREAWIHFKWGQISNEITPS